MTTYVVSFAPEISVQGPLVPGPDCHWITWAPDPPAIFAVKVDVPPTQIVALDTDTVTVGSAFTTAIAAFEITGLGHSLCGGSTV